MKTFKQYITEGRDAPLYHGCTDNAIRGILADGLSPRTEQQNKKLLKQVYMDKNGQMNTHTNGVSMTREIKFAQQWGGWVVLQFDQRKLAQRYQIIPLQYWANHTVGARYIESRGAGTRPSPWGKPKVANEYEEFVVTGRSIPIEKYCTAIHIKDTDGFSEAARDAVEEWCSKHNVKLQKWSVAKWA